MPRVSASPRRLILLGAIVAFVAVAGLGGLIYARSNLPFDVDTEWMQEIVEHRGPFWDVPSFVMNFLGGGWFGVFLVPLSIVAILLLAKRKWAALYFALSAALSAGLVQLLKSVFGRPRPDDILVAADFGSFPSGHVANAATTAVVLGLVLHRAWIWAAGAVYTVLMLLSRTYLGAHWLSDTLGGLILGAAVAIIVWASLADRLHGEWASRRSASES